MPQHYESLLPINQPIGSSESSPVYQSIGSSECSGIFEHNTPSESCWDMNRIEVSPLNSSTGWPDDNTYAGHPQPIDQHQNPDDCYEEDNEILIHNEESGVEIV